MTTKASFGIPVYAQCVYSERTVCFYLGQKDFLQKPFIRELMFMRTNVCHVYGVQQYFQGCAQIADEAHSVRHRHITTEAAGGDDSV